MNRRIRTASESLGFLAVLGGILLAVNVIGFFAYQRFDVTEKRLYSLSDGSRDVAARLSDTLEITAYFTEDLPPPYNATERHVLDLLEEYRSASNGHIIVNLVHPDSDDEKQQAEEDGIIKMRHPAVQDDAVTAVDGYRGLVMRYLDQREVLPALDSADGLEYTLTMKIKELIGDRTEIALLSGHDGPTLTKGLSRLRTCLPTYEITEVSATEEIDRDVRALLVVEPHSALTDVELRRINQFVMRGGSLGVFGGSMQIDLESGPEPAATPADTGINTILRRWGVKVENGIVADARCGRAPLQTRIGALPVPHPIVPIVRFDEAAREHPALFHLDGTHLPFVSPLSLTTLSDDQVHVTTLARSSDDNQSWNIDESSVSLRPRAPQEWSANGPVGPFPLIVAVEGRLPSAFGAGGDEPGMSGAPDAGAAPEASDIEAPARAASDVRIFVVGGGFLLRDEIQGPAQEGEEQCNLSGTLGVALNAIDWLAQDDDLIAVRAKNIAESPIDVPQNVLQAEEEAVTAEQTAIEAAQQGDEGTARSEIAERDEALERRKDALEAWDSKKALYRWGNMLGLPAAFALFGLVRWQIRKRQRAAIKV